MNFDLGPNVPRTRGDELNLWIVGPKIFMKFLLIYNETRVKAGLKPLDTGIDEIDIQDGYIWMIEGAVPDDGDTVKRIKLFNVPRTRGDEPNRGGIYGI